MSTVYIGLGSNLGNRQKNIYDALEHLEKNNIKVLRQSTIIETEPMGGPPQDHYLNAVIKVDTNHYPQELLRILKSIEKQLGRIKTVADGPRLIDLDILLFDDIQMNTPHLTIPHPRMFERDFVLKPLTEIAPEYTNSSVHARN